MIESKLMAAELVEIQEIAERVAREEIASLCGLVLRRLQDESKFGGINFDSMSSIFGEALRDFSSDTDEPGEK